MIQKRAMSVAENEVIGSPELKQQKIQQEPPRRAGAYRSAGVKA